jgi:hypothetical protein
MFFIERSFLECAGRAKRRRRFGYDGVLFPNSSFVADKESREPHYLVV